MRLTTFNIVVLFLAAFVSIVSVILIFESLIKEDFQTDLGEGSFVGVSFDFKVLILAAAISMAYIPLARNTFEYLRRKSKRDIEIAFYLAILLCAIHLAGILIFNFIVDNAFGSTPLKLFFQILSLFFLIFMLLLAILRSTNFDSKEGELKR